jgi:lysophospholipase L1-like esterase
MEKKLFTIIVLVMVASLSVAGCTSPTTSNQTTGSASQAVSFRKIVCLGDSITWGGYTSPTYPVLLQIRLNTVSSGWKVINEGVNGDTTAQMLARFQTDVVANNPQYVVIMGGANDPSAATTESNIDAMCKLAVANGITPIIMMMTPDGPRCIIVNNWESSYAAASRYSIIDSYTPLNDPNNPSHLLPAYVDHNIHPNALGFTALVNSINLAVFGPHPTTTGVSSGDTDFAR